MQPTFHLNATSELDIPHAIGAKVFRGLISQVGGFGHKALYCPGPERAAIAKPHDLSAFATAGAAAILAGEGMLTAVLAATA